MPASDRADIIEEFEDTPFGAIEYLRDKHPEVIDATRETAEAVVEKLATDGTLDHDDVAAPAEDIHYRRGRVLTVGRSPTLPMDTAVFYWNCVVGTVRTHPQVSLNGWTLDANLALAGAALDDCLQTVTFPDNQHDRFVAYVKRCLEYLRQMDVPVTAFELHDYAPSVPVSADDMDGHETALSVLADLPGVNAPDPDAPAWQYVGESADE